MQHKHLKFLTECELFTAAATLNGIYYSYLNAIETNKGSITSFSHYVKLRHAPSHKGNQSTVFFHMSTNASKVGLTA